MRTSCCLNLPPPTSNQASNIPIKPPHVSLVKKEGYWRRQCVMIGVASHCTIIGIGINNNLVDHHEAAAVAHEIVSKNRSSSPVSVSGSKWSQKSACPSWRGNSLETIVPENLPRPAARRRYELVGGSTNKDAPSLSLQESIKHRSTKGSCFSM